MNKNSKYYIVTNKDMATTLKMITRQEPFIYPNKFKNNEYVWSFVNDEAFQEALNFILKMIAKNKSR